MGGIEKGSIQRSIRHELEWLAVTGDAVHGRILGMPLREAQHAAQHLFPEWERTVQVIGRASATAAQLRGSAAAPAITARTLQSAGIEPRWLLDRQAERRADQRITQRMEAWAARHQTRAGGGR